MPIQYGGDRITFADGSSVGNGWSGFKNRIINGDMRVDQRNAGASYGTTTLFGNYTLDRWQAVYSTTNKYTVQQNAGGVTPPAGFNYYLGVTSSSAYTVGASELYTIDQKIEGFNFGDCNFGLSSAATITLSFWVRSSLTGTFGLVVQNGANNRNYPATYTISAANTWEYKTITIPGDITGTWNTTSSTGLHLRFGLGVGGTVSGTPGAWNNSASCFGATGATSVLATNGATWYVTGVQIEKGFTASSFDYRPVTTEVALCQRYYEALSIGSGSAGGLYGSNASLGYLHWFFKVTKRASPTVTLGAGSAITIDFTGTDAVGGYRNGYPYIANGTVASAEL